MKRGALGHLRILELSDGLAAAECGRQFAAWGADVIVVEPPEGHPLRSRPPLAAGGARSLAWEHLAARKRSIRAAPTDRHARARLGRLAAEADVVVSDWPVERFAATLDAPAAPPLRIDVLLSPFDIRRPGGPVSQLTLQAESGLLSLSGRGGQPPLRLPANILPYAAGAAAFIGGLAAVRERYTSGLGQRVHVAELDVLASLVLVLRSQYFGDPFPRRSGVGTLVLPCAEGSIVCSPRYDQGWSHVLAALGVDEASVPEHLRQAAGRESDEALLEFLGPLAARVPAVELFETLGALGAVAGLLQSPQNLLTNPHHAETGGFSRVPVEGLGQLKFPGPPAVLSETPSLPPAAAPLRPAGRQRWKARPRGSPAIGGRLVAGSSSVPRAPLAGIRVLDLTGAWIGPFAAMFLADLGADVVKVESPVRPDIWRGYRPGATAGYQAPTVARAGAHPWNISHYYNSVNRNKRSLSLDLGSPAGRELFMRLASDADIVMDNFTPRVMRNFGLDYECLRSVNPGIITVSFSGYGPSGPWANFKANGATTETTGGWVSLFGYPGEGPMLLGEMEADPLSGLQMAASALVALEYRSASGAGQAISGSMFSAAVGYIAEELLFAQAGEGPGYPRGNLDRSGAFEAVLPAAGEDRWIALSVQDDEQWRALLGLAGRRVDLSDARFQTPEGRFAAAPELEALLAPWTQGTSGPQLVRRLRAAGIPAALVLRTDELAASPRLRKRFRALTHLDTGPSLHLLPPWRFSRSATVWALPPPRLGEHSAEILARECGITPEAFAELARAGVTGSVATWHAPSTAAPAPAHNQPAKVERNVTT